MKRIFLTQEIGSLQRPAWRQRLDGPAEKAWVGEALAWGERLGVEERQELKALLEKTARTEGDKRRIVEISSIYAMRMFETAGLDRVFNGEQPRTEMYDFMARHTKGIETAGVLNSFDANYFRKGIITGPVEIMLEGLEFFSEEMKFVNAHSKKEAKPCLTGPYTMMDWSYVEHHRAVREGMGEKPLEALKNGRQDAALEFAEKVLNPAVRRLAEDGARVIQIDEPAASTNERDSEVFAEAINACFEGIPRGVEKAVHLCYSDYPALFPALAECKADTYLIEFTNHTSPAGFRPDQVSPEAFQAIGLFNEYGMRVNVGVGVADIHSDEIEAPETVRDRLLYAEKLVGDPARVQANPDCGLRTRRWEVAYKKLCNMAEGAALARKEFGE
jgi:5-methyltetrahydropteroyltriglutamate--homocysteine methyltransferase